MNKTEKAAVRVAMKWYELVINHAPYGTPRMLVYRACARHAAALKAQKKRRGK